MGIRGVLFDFSGTLFRLERASWVEGATLADGSPMDPAMLARISARAGGPISSFATFDTEHQHAWDNRDLDPELNRKAFLDVLRQLGVDNPDHAERLYARIIDPHLWTPYVDAAKALAGLAERGIPVAVVSNIAFDIRPAFTRHGLDAHIGEFVLSYEHGVIKPDPKIFRLALDRIGVDPAEALMIGDHEELDGGARALGSAFAQVAHEPVESRPDALLYALRTHGVL